MIKRLKNIQEFIQANLYTLLALIFVVVLTAAYIFFYVSAIDPGLANRTRIETQLDDARRQLVNARSRQEDPPEVWQTRVADARATLANSTNAFLTSEQSTQAIDLLYQYARASGVTIIDLQVPPTPTPLPTPTWTPTRLPTPLPSPTSQTRTAATQPSQAHPTPTQPAPPTATRVQTSPAQSPSAFFYVRPLRLRARGTSRQLVDFASRLKEANMTGVVINSFNILGGEGTPQATLTMDVSLFVLYGASDAPVTRAPTSPPPPAYPTPVIPTQTPSPTWIFVTVTPPPTPTWTLTPSPTPRYIIHVVQPGDTLFSLARRYNTTVEAIRSLNRLPNTNIRVGQQLMIPAP
ncbi:MAG: LysM peptidoglycan-binding domain-containing protein [Chloroflexota bacterium]